MAAPVAWVRAAPTTRVQPRAMNESVCDEASKTQEGEPRGEGKVTGKGR